MALLAEIQATCSAMGYMEDGVYMKEPDCLECVKDLIRYLKREDDTCDIRRLLGEAQIVQNDLLPLVKESLKDAVMLDTVVRLLVNLTQPAIICFQGYIPTEKTQHNYYLEVLGHLGTYKQAFAEQTLFQALCQKVGEILQLDWENRQEEDRMLLERILILIRNVLHIAPLEDERRTDDDASIHDQVLWALHTSGMEDLLLYIANSNEERQFAMHVLEIVSLLFREQSADQLAKAGAGRTMTEKEKDEQELLQSRMREKVQKRITNAKYSTRHSRFGGTYVLANLKSITDNAMIYHRSQGDIKNISFDLGKQPKKLGKNRKPLLEDNSSRRSTLSIRLALKNFCIQFILNCYNPLMSCVRDRLQHNQADENDETYYIWAMRFFMEFQRNYKFRVDVISETLSLTSFHYIHVQIMKYNDMMITNKNEAKTWGKRMHLAVKAYKELLLTVIAMDRANVKIRDSAKILKSNIFYVPEYKDLILLLLVKFNQSRQSRSYLKDLIETTHVFLKMLEQYCSGKSRVLVQSKRRRKNGQKKAKRRQMQPEQNQEEPADLDGRWSEISGDLSAVIQGREELPEIVSPFDAASEVAIEQQKDNTMYRIHDCLREQRPGEALALLRAARQVWPDQEIFGPPEMNPEEEFMAMRQIFFTSLHRPDEQISQPVEEDEGDEEVSDDEEEHEAWTTSEQQFEFKDYLMKFLRPEIMKPYVLLLSEYNRNSPQMNHYLVKMLHRIAVDCKVPGMLFQMSLFRVFQKLIKDPTTRVTHKELVKFAHFIIIKFFDMENKDAFHEILFWKNVRESLELIDGFGTYKAEKVKSSGWREEEEMELQRLYEEFKDREDPELDVVDMILKDIINKNRTRRQIIAKLAHMDLIQSAKDIKKKKNRSKEWMEEDEAQLQGLFHEHKDSRDVLDQILTNLNVKRSKNAVIKKLLGLGLISDRKDISKRRTNKRKSDEELERPPKSKEFLSSGEDDTDNENNESFDSSNSESETRKKSAKKNPGRNRKDDSSDDDGAFLNFISKTKKSASKPPVGSLDTHVKKIIEEGLQDDVEWIFATFKDEAADREDEKPDDATPIVPLTPSNSAALDNASFKAMLRILGARPPADVQERYWRIPEYFTPGMLEERVKNLQSAKENAKEPPPDESSDKENKTPKAKLNKRHMSEASSDDDDPLKLVLDDSLVASGSTQSPPTKRVRLDSEDDQPINGKKRRKPEMLLFSDEESAEPSLKLSEMSQNLTPSLDHTPAENTNTQDLVDGDQCNDESGNSKKGQDNFKKMFHALASSDSDSDVEDRIPLRKVIRRPMIDSDSD